MDKAVIFIVEGATDKRTLENIFKKIYKNKGIHFEFTHGDITSDETINKNNVEDEIYKYVDKYKQSAKLELSDIWQIVQIFDMDGAYIDDANITCKKILHHFSFMFISIYNFLYIFTRNIFC